MSDVTFADIRPAEPDRDRILERLDGLIAQIGSAADEAAVLTSVRAWDRVRREVETWSAYVTLRFHQATGDAERRAANERCDELAPVLAARDARFKRALLGSPYRHAVASAFGDHALALWSCDVEAVDDRIVENLTAEAALEADYVMLLGGARVAFAGGEHSLPGIAAFAEDPDRAVREGAARARWSFFDEHRDAFDRLYDGLVRERTAAARALGYADFVELGYRRMRRTDYGAEDVARFRDEVVREIVPLCARLAEDQARRIGVDRLMPWDAEVYDDGARLRPPEGRDLVRAGRAALADIDPRLGGFADMMERCGLLDLPVREGKAGGGFCTFFPENGVPFVFANANGTTNDVNVLVHELGHAFQCYTSREVPLCDYLWPTFDAAEIDSMGLEFLVRPHLENFFGADAARYRRRHLAGSLMMMPYGCAVDHFQHLVYERPEATPSERHAMWRSLEERYLPWRVDGGIPHVARGGSWQAQRHIYKVPFYYIDYILAMSCALQFWLASLADPADAFARYAALCGRGGEAPFQTLVRSAGLRSPLDGGVLASVAERAAAELLAGAPAL